MGLSGLSGLSSKHSWARCVGLAACMLSGTALAQNGSVQVAGTTLLRDGTPWVPHGYYQIAYEVPPGVPGSYPFWAIARNDWTPLEYVQMRQAGADSVRIQVAQTGMDPTNHYSTPAFRARALFAIATARAAGLTVIVSLQAETQAGTRKAPDLPDDSTRRAWRQIVPFFGKDKGVLLELLNEPQLSPATSATWQAWAQAMDKTITAVRHAGSVNVVVADGLEGGETLNGAPALDDPLHQVVYADHPYAFDATQQTAARWDATFGAFAKTHPVIITEWGIGYYCDDKTPDAVLTFFQYLQHRHIGLEISAWDWSTDEFGSAVYGFPQSRFSSFLGPAGGVTGCHATSRNGYHHPSGQGPGKMVETWYRTGAPPTVVQ